MFSRAVLWIAISILLPQAVHARYLQSETLTFPTNGRPVQTTLPLDPAHQYHVTVTSSYNLRAFLVACSYYDNVSRSFFGLIEEHDRFTLCKPPLLFNGKQLPTARWRDYERGSYYVQNTEIEFYIPALHFYFWGTGAPLTLRTSTDLSHKVRTASVKITDFTWEEERRQEAQRREQERKEALRRQQEAAARAETEAWLERQRQERARQQEIEQERKETEMRVKQRLASRIRTSVVAGALAIITLFVWWLMATSGRREEARLARQRRERQEREAVAAARARAEAEQAEAKRRAEEQQRMKKDEQRRRQREAAEEKRRRQAEEAEAQRRREAEALEAERHARFRMLQSRYGDRLFAWRTDDAALARYAREHRNELLDPKRQKEIIRDYTAFQDDDLDFVEWLRTNHTDLYHRIDEVFYYRVRALAESLAAEEKPRRPKLSPEEREAKFARYRERALERDRIQAEDRMAAVRQKLDLLQQFRDDLDGYDLDEDERDRLIKEFEDDLFAHPEENFDGNFKQV